MLTNTNVHTEINCRPELATTTGAAGHLQAAAQQTLLLPLPHVNLIDKHLMSCSGEAGLRLQQPQRRDYKRNPLFTLMQGSNAGAGCCGSNSARTSNNGKHQTNNANGHSSVSNHHHHSLQAAALLSSCRPEHGFRCSKAVK